MIIKPYTCVFLLLVFESIPIMAQNDPIDVKGKVIEISNLPIEFATVLIKDIITEEALDGVTTNKNGFFEISTFASNFYIEISFIGYESIIIKDLIINEGVIDIGTVKLTEDVNNLDEILIRAETSQTTFKLDKRIFNVGKDLSNTGANALEVLNNVPSVTVSIEGVISLRGNSGVQILINGKPSVVADGNVLSTITADMIEKIEVITNPGAKFNASGTSGIINIILYKSEKKGLNGSVTLNAGIPKNHSVGLSLNHRSKKINIFAQLGYGDRLFPVKFDSDTEDRIESATLLNEGEREKNEEFFNIILGTDYSIDSLNIVTLSGRYAYENEIYEAFTNYAILDHQQIATDRWRRDEFTEGVNPKWSYELEYKKDFKNNKEHDLLLSVSGSSFVKDIEGNFDELVFFGNSGGTRQRTFDSYDSKNYSFQLDYVYPFSDNFALEAGSQYSISNTVKSFRVDNFLNNTWETDSNLKYDYDFQNGILGVFATGAYRNDVWGIKLGFRLENTNIKSVLKTTNERINQDYANLFPSLHTSYKFSDTFSLQFGYSRRIDRPYSSRLFNLRSFGNNFNFSIGNPELQPEFTDSYEIASIFKIEKGIFNIGFYHRYTTDVIENIITVDENIITSKPFNVGIDKTYGLEINGKYTIFNWASLTTDFNLLAFRQQGNYEQTNYDFKSNRSYGRFTLKLKLPNNITLETSGNYRSKYKSVQFKRLENYYMDLGLRKKFFSGRLVTNMSVRDVFASNQSITLVNQTNLYRKQKSYNGRFITFGLSYGFGKGDALEFSGQKQF